MNVMTLGSIKVPKVVAEEMVEAFLSTKTRGGRHRRRRDKIELRQDHA